MTTAIVKYQPLQQPDFDAFVAAMFLMFARAPRKAEPDIDGSYEDAQGIRSRTRPK